MLDRAIGMAGLAVTLIFWALPYLAPKLPSWMSTVGLGVGLLALGLSVGLVIADRRNAGDAPQPADKALLRLHTYGDNRIPDRLAQENIFRWYYLRTTFVVIPGTADQQQSAAVSTTLFVTFQPEVKISTIQVRSPDLRLPPYEVKEFNQRYAIITFAGEIGLGTLEVSVSP